VYDIFNTPGNSYYSGTFSFKIKINKKLFTEHKVKRKLSGLGILFIEIDREH
jgi:hypothetical protein